MTKLVKHKSAAWGDDLVEARESGKEIVGQTVKKVLATYLLQLRKILETNSRIKQIVIDSDPAKAAKPKLMKLLAFECKPDSEDLFEQAIDIILDELDNFREKPSSLYLVDGDTGMTVMPMTDELIYTPPDYIGEDGKLHKAKPILHPGMAASLTLAVYGQAKIQRHLKKAADPISKQAYKHLSGAEQILEMAKDRLGHIGVKISDNPDKCDQIVEFGREQVEGVMQSPNIRFHRAHMFAAVLAHKILELGGRSAEYFVGSIENKKNAKQSWYTVEIGVN